MKEIYVVFYKRNLEKGGGSERRFLRLYNYISNEYENIRINFVTNEENQNTIYNFIDKNNSNIECHFIKQRNKYIDWYYFIDFFESNIDKIKDVHIISPNRCLFFLYLYLIKRQINLYLSVTSCTVAQGKFNRSILNRLMYNILIKKSLKIDWLYPYYETYWNKENVLNKSYVTPNSFTIFDNLNHLENKENYIVFLGQLIDEKQPLMLLEAVNDIKETLINKNWKVFVVGGGKLENKIKKYIQKNNLEDIVLMTYSIDNTELLSKSKVFVSLQKHDNYPSQSLLEAINFENIIVSTNVGNTKQILNENDSFLISNKDELSICLNKIINGDTTIQAENLSRLKKEVMLKHNIKNAAAYLYNFLS